MRHTLQIGLTLAALSLGSCSSSKSPDGTVRDLVGDLTRGKAGSIWHALPASYQGDVQKALSMVAEKLDPEIYDEGFKIARAMIAELQSKAFMLNDVMPAQFAQIDFDEHGDEIFELFDKLASGPVTTVAGIRTLDVGKFLDQTGGALYDALSSFAEAKGQDLGDALSQLQLDVTNESGDSCVLIMGSGAAPMKMPVPFQRVEGKWIPTALVAAWPQMMTKIRNGIREMESMKDPARKKELQKSLARANKQLAALKKAQSADDVRSAMAAPPK